MTKTSLLLTSLVAAIPGALLFVLMLNAVLRYMEPMPGLLKIVAIITLVMSILAAAFPAYIWIWYGTGGQGVLKKAKDKKGKADQEAPAAAPQPAEEEAAEEPFADDELAETEPFEAGDFEESPSEAEADIFEPSTELEEDFEFEEFEDDEEK